MVNQLPKVKIDGKVYYQDDRLQEYRQVTSPQDRIKYEDIGDKVVEPVETRKSITHKRKLK